MNNTFYTLGDPAATPDPLSLPPLGADPAEARRTFSRIGIAYASKRDQNRKWRFTIKKESSMCTLTTARYCGNILL